ncbi:hypothetical protein FRB97_008503 [Tulasnella sp. 331]|nr:hypothetical protein FRB97_008503 [Tulasnella sp. 331]KAG8888816.1 hypothetical protein FRB98_006712 [Tulasnella sp. 332]
MTNNIKLKSALDELKNSTLRDKKLTRIVASLSRSLTPLLKWKNASGPEKTAPAVIADLIELFNTKILPLYQTVTEHALHVAALTADAIYYKRLVPNLGSNSSDASRKAIWHVWEDVLEQGILEGVLVYMSSSGSNRGAVGAHLFSLLCPMLYERSCENLGVLLRRQIASLLSDSVMQQRDNYIRLMDPAVFGIPLIVILFKSSHRRDLGQDQWYAIPLFVVSTSPTTGHSRSIAFSLDFLLIETMAELTQRFAPKKGGRDVKDFAETMFSSSVCLKAFGAQTVAGLITAFKNPPQNRAEFPLFMLKTLSAVDIQKPQYFSTDEILVMGQTIPLPDGQRYICIDHTTIFAAFDAEDEPGVLDTMQVSLLTVESISLSSSQTSMPQAQLTLRVSQPPTLASLPMASSSGHQLSAPYTIELSLDKAELSVLRKVLASRQLTSKLLDEGSSRKKNSVAMSRAPVSLEMALPASPKAGSSFQTKSREVSDLLAGGSGAASSDVQVEMSSTASVKQPIVESVSSINKLSTESFGDESDLSDTSDLEESQSQIRLVAFPLGRKHRVPSPQLSPLPPPPPSALIKARSQGKKYTSSVAVQNAAPNKSDRIVPQKRARAHDSDAVGPEVDVSPPPKRQVIRRTIQGRKGPVPQDIPTSREPQPKAPPRRNNTVPLGSPRKTIQVENQPSASALKSNSEWEDPPAQPIRRSRKKQPSFSRKRNNLSVDSPTKRAAVSNLPSTGPRIQPARSLRSDTKNTVSSANIEHAKKIVMSKVKEAQAQSVIDAAKLKKPKATAPWLPEDHPFELSVAVTSTLSVEPSSLHNLDLLDPSPVSTSKSSKTTNRNPTLATLAVTYVEPSNRLAVVEKREDCSDKASSSGLLADIHHYGSDDERQDKKPVFTEMHEYDETPVNVSEEHISSFRRFESGISEQGDMTMVDAFNQPATNDLIYQSNSKKHLLSRSVTFASQVHTHAPFGDRIADGVPGQTPQRHTDIDVQDHRSRKREDMAISSTARPPSKVQCSQQQDHDRCVAPWQAQRRDGEAPTKITPPNKDQALLNVLNSIRDAIVDNLNNKFDGVRSEVRIARDNLFQDAREDLGRIHNENVIRQRELHHLEQEINHCRQTVQSQFRKVQRGGDDIEQRIKQVIRTHDANVLKLSNIRHGGLLFGGKDKPFRDVAAL